MQGGGAQNFFFKIQKNFKTSPNFLKIVESRHSSLQKNLVLKYLGQMQREGHKQH